MDSFRLYLVAGMSSHLVDEIDSAISGGVTSVQIRIKNETDRTVLDLARPVVAMCHDMRVPVFINDRIDLALILGAEGVHLGVDDLPLESARQLAPPDFQIGYSPETDVQIRTAADRGATYLGMGPVYETSTKLDAGSPLGLEEFSRRCELTSLPVLGIGGITASNAMVVVTHGATGVAVSSAVLKAPDIRRAAEELRTALHQ